MNYATDCLNHLTSLIRAFQYRGHQSDALAVQFIIDDLVVATKYLLPPPHLLNVGATSSALGFVKLPYKICAFEYAVPTAREEGGPDLIHKTTASSKRIALAYDCSAEVGPVPILKKSGHLPTDASGILVISLYYLDTERMWMPAIGAGYIDSTYAEDGSVNMLLDNKHLRTALGVIPILPEAFKTQFRNNPHSGKSTMVNDVAEELCTAVRACLLLNARNVQDIVAIEEPVALNKKRARSNKPPYFEYRTLDIFVAAGARLFDRKRLNYGEIQKAFAHNMVCQKWHTVAGHLKVRKSGIFWWSEHARGSKDRGVIVKDYVVKST